MKVAKLIKVMRSGGKFEVIHIHTNQHSDTNLSTNFFTDLNLVPDIIIPVINTTASIRLAYLISELASLFCENKLGLVIVPGDVDSTLAAALAAYKENISIAHIESGLRSFDRTMPEEINRILVDELAEFHFVTEESCFKNLSHLPRENQFFVGNTMIDSIVEYTKFIDSSEVLETNNLRKGEFILCTFHRPSNVDSVQKLKMIFDFLDYFSSSYQIVFPMHPRTIKMANSILGKFPNDKRVKLLGPQNYFDFQRLIKESKGVFTDSGGIQEETSYYGIPCCTFRENTERPITLSKGSNILVKSDHWLEPLIVNEIECHLQKEFHSEIPMWDGFATERIVDILNTRLC